MITSEELAVELRKTRLIAVTTIPSSDLAVPLAKSLIEGGVQFIEITFRNENAEKSIKEIKNANLNIYLGAGTVRTVDQAERAMKAGVQYIVAPGFNPKIVSWATSHKIPVYPGVDSTLGIEQAIDAGLKTVKMFPAAEIGGVAWLKAMKGPYYDINFIPTGGVDMKNLKDFLSLSNVLAVGGSFIAPSDLLTQKKFDEIVKICKDAISISKSIVN